MANPLNPFMSGVQNLYTDVTGALRGADLQGALANPMFLYGASILGRGKSRSPQPLFNMQELMQAQQVADSYKKRQFLSDLAERSQDYSAKREALEAGESALSDIMKQKYFYDDKDDPITGQPYGQLLSAEEAFSIGGKTPEELQAAQTLTGLSPTYDFASTDPAAMTRENIGNLTQADLQANVLAETGVDPMSRQALMTAMLESGSPDLVASAIAERMKLPTTTVVGEGDTLLSQHPTTGEWTTLLAGGPKLTSQQRNAEALAEQPIPVTGGGWEYRGERYNAKEDAIQAKDAFHTNMKTAFTASQSFVSPSAWESQASLQAADLADQGRQSNKILANVEVMGNIAEGTDFNTNVMTKLTKPVRSFVQAITGNEAEAEAISKMETFGAMGTELLRISLNAAKGPQTDRDAATLQQGLPSLGKLPATNKILLDMIKMTNYRIREKARFVEGRMQELSDQGQLRNANMYYSVLQEWAENDTGLFEENPALGANSERNKTARRLKATVAGLRDPVILPPHIDPNNSGQVEAWGRENGLQQGRKILVNGREMQLIYPNGG